MSLVIGVSLGVIGSTACFAQQPPLISQSESDALRAIAAKGHIDKLIEALQAMLARHPEYAASKAGAANVSALVAEVLTSRFQGDPLIAGLARAGGSIVESAPAGDRGEIAQAVVETMLRPPRVPGTDAPSPTIVARAPAVPGIPLSLSAASREMAALELLGAPQAAEAQREAPTDAVLQRTPGVNARPIRLGSFLLYPDVTLAALLDDNIFATRRLPVDDLIGIVSPFVELESSWNRHVLRFEAGAEIGRYADNANENYSDWWLETEGRIDIGSKHNIFGGVAIKRFHESRESPDDVNGTEPTTYDVNSAYAGTTIGVGDVSMRISSRYEGLDFSPVAVPTGTIDNLSRDRQVYTGGANLTFRPGGPIQLFAQGAFDIRRYDADLTVAPFDRDSDGIRVSGGIRYSSDRSLRVELYGGYLRQSYDDARFRTIKAPFFGSQVEWQADPLTTVDFNLDRTLVESTLDDTSGVLSTGASLGITHVLADKVQINSSVAYRHGDYRGIDRNDDVINASAGVRYLVGRRVYLETVARFRHLHSTTVFEDYDRTQLLFRIGIQPYASPPSYDAWRMRPDEAPDEPHFAGFYSGVFAGYASLDSTVTGPRSTAGEVQSDYGGSGTEWGVMAGYGAMLSGSVYAGFEVDGDTGGTSWRFDRGVETRQFSLRKRLSYSASALAGFVIRRRALVYGRAGLSRAELISRYKFGTTELDQDFTRNGIRFGAGLAYAIDQHLQLRAELNVTDYKRFVVDYSTGVDTFETDTAQTRLAFSYQF